MKNREYLDVAGATGRTNRDREGAGATRQRSNPFGPSSQVDHGPAKYRLPLIRAISISGDRPLTTARSIRRAAERKARKPHKKKPASSSSRRGRMSPRFLSEAKTQSMVPLSARQEKQHKKKPASSSSRRGRISPRSQTLRLPPASPTWHSSKNCSKRPPRPSRSFRPCRPPTVWVRFCSLTSRFRLWFVF